MQNAPEQTYSMTIALSQFLNQYLASMNLIEGGQIGKLSLANCFVIR
jgi:hypothetical protein